MIDHSHWTDTPLLPGVRNPLGSAEDRLPDAIDPDDDEERGDSSDDIKNGVIPVVRQLAHTSPAHVHQNHFFQRALSLSADAAISAQTT